MLLSQALSNRSNGLTQVRLVLAFFVLFDHAFALNGRPHPPLGYLPMSLSQLAVWLFIFLSGLLCFRSAERHGMHRYLLLRAARLMPGYCLCLLLMGLLLLPLFLALGFAADTGWLELPGTTLQFWLKNLLLDQGQFAPPGWLSQFPVRAFKGSLWTLQPEWMGYIVILLLAPLFLRSARVALLCFAAFDLVAALWPKPFRLLLKTLLGGYGFEIDSRSYLHLALYLLAGLLYYRLADRIPLRRSWAAAALGVLLLAGFSRLLFALLAPLLLPYLLLVVAGLIPWPWQARDGDLSYGVYLYSFPLQQLLVGVGLLRGAPLPLVLQIVLAGLLALPLAWFSWAVVERPVLRWASAVRLPPLAEPPGRAP